MPAVHLVLLGQSKMGHTAFPSHALQNRSFVESISSPEHYKPTSPKWLSLLKIKPVRGISPLLYFHREHRLSLRCLIDNQSKA